VTSLSKNGKKQKFQFEEVIKPGKVAIGRNLVPVLYAISDDGSLAPVDRPSLERLSRFHQRTVFSIGNEDTAPLFQKACLELACTVFSHFVSTSKEGNRLMQCNAVSLPDARCANPDFGA
jgi:hypothetical protein